ncbi:hypothetical protein Ddc_00425 [Ditylenchus destructor]|nr:hypothetical protein Ddc_00425 [Ditylenchus destructor]
MCYNSFLFRILLNLRFQAHLRLLKFLPLFGAIAEEIIVSLFDIDNGNTNHTDDPHLERAGKGSECGGEFAQR